MIDSDTQKHKKETDQRQINKYRQQQEIQNYLKGQMEHVFKEKENDMIKKEIDAIDIKLKTK